MPTYGQFTDYRPVSGVPGAYDFSTGQGNPMRFFGQPAEELRAKLDAARGPDLRTASNPATQNPNVATDAPTPVAGVRPMFAGLPEAVAQASAPEPVPQEQGQPAPPAEVAIASTPGGGVLKRLADGTLVEDLPARRATKGGLVQRGQTVQGAQNIDPDQLAAIDAAQVRSLVAQEEAREQAATDAAAMSAYYEEQQAQAAQQAAIQQRQQEQIADRVRQTQAQYDQAEREYASFQIDTKKARGGDVGTLISALAAAGGAFGAGLARTPNFAQEIINRNIENNLAAQRAEQQVKKDVQDNLYSELLRQFGTQEQASLAFRALKTKQAALGFEQRAAMAKSSEEQGRMRAASEAALVQHLKWREELTRNAQGEITKSFAYVPGQAASAGGRRLATLGQHEQIAGIEGKFATTAKTRADTARVAAGGDGKPIPQPQLDALTGAANTIVAASRIANALEKIGATESTLDDPLGGVIDKARRQAGSAIGSERSRALDGLEADTELMAKGMQTAFGKSDRDAEDALRMAQGKASGADRLRSARQAADRAMTVLKQQFTNMTPEQQQAQLNALPAEVRRELLSQ